MKKNFLKENKELIIFGILMYIFSFVIMCKSPLNSDDFEFINYNYHKLSEIVTYCLYYGNGRLLGNIGVFYLLNFPILGAMIKAMVLSAIVMIIPFMLKIKYKQAYYISFILFFGMNPSIFAQIATWTSGFQNYVPPVLLLFIVICIVENYNCKSIVKLILVAILGIAMQLYVEHCTIINLLLSITMCLYYKKENQERKKECSFIWSIASFIGMIMMVLIPKIFYISNNRTEGYRQIHLDSIGNIINSIVQSLKFLMATYSQCITLWIFLGITGIALLNITKTKLQSSKIKMILKMIFSIYPVIVISFNIISMENNKLYNIFKYLLLYGGMLICAIAIAITIIYISDRNLKKLLVIFTSVALISLAPFLIISPFGERCMFVSYICFILFILTSFKYTLQEKFWSPISINKKVLYLIMILLSVGIIYEYTKLEKWDNERTSYIKECMDNGENEIIVFENPSKYSFTTYLLNKYYYYEEQGDIKFEVIEYEEWKKIQNMK